MQDMNRWVQSNMGFGRILDYSLAEDPNRTAVICGGRRLTYQEFDSQIRRFSLVLEADGVRQGDCVAIISRNCIEFLVAELAILRVGAVSVKINWRLAPEEIQYLLDLNDVHYVVARYERQDWGRQIYERNKNRIKFYVINPDKAGISPFQACIEAVHHSEKFVDREISPDTPAFRVHTSGTTGKPKCVVHTHGQLLRQLCCCVPVLAFRPGEVFQVINQLFHIACMGPYMVLATGGTLVLMSRFDIREYLESMVREKVTGISIIPMVLKRILEYPQLDQYDLSHLKFINYSTAPMPLLLLEEAVKKFRCDFYQSYGMTEMSSIVTVLSPQDHYSDGQRHLSSVGKAIPGVEIRIETQDGTMCPPGQLGEIVVRGPGQMEGYYGVSQDCNERVLRGGWYHTGDIGRLDEDGFLHIQGRRDDMIISGGENIYPSEILDILLNLEGIQEAAVYGVPDPDWGERVKASVVLLPECQLTEQDILHYCRARMPHYKAPKEVELLPELPKNSIGKVLIPALKEAAHVQVEPPARRVDIS